MQIPKCTDKTRKVSVKHLFPAGGEKTLKSIPLSQKITQRAKVDHTQLATLTHSPQTTRPLAFFNDPPATPHCTPATPTQNPSGLIGNVISDAQSPLQVTRTHHDGVVYLPLASRSSTQSAHEETRRDAMTVDGLVYFPFDGSKASRMAEIETVRTQTCFLK